VLPLSWSHERRIFPARFEKIRDGDTFWFTVDTGLHQRAEWPLRLDTYDAFEEDEAGGAAAVLFAEQWFLTHQRHSRRRFPFVILTRPESKRSPYERMTLGRFVAQIICEGDGEDFGPALAAAGWTK
jgi:endonuclease YncB( thermonuclease family)